jgi:hypothetical protein
MAEQIDPLNYCQLVPGFAPARDKWGREPWDETRMATKESL